MWGIRWAVTGGGDLQGGRWLGLGLELEIHPAPGLETPPGPSLGIGFSLDLGVDGPWAPFRLAWMSHGRQ